MAQQPTARSTSSRGAKPPQRRDGLPSWLNLEIGTAEHLRRFYRVDLGSPPRREARHAMVLEAAESLLPECAVENLPGLARDELAAGLNGPLRRQIAATEATEDALDPLRDRLVTQISGLDPRKGAIVVADQVHLRRLVRGDVPPIVSAGCLSWYGSYRQPEDPDADEIAALLELEQAWLDFPKRRARLDEQMMAIAVGVVGERPTSLIDDDV